MKKWIKKTLFSSVFLLCLCAVACGEGKTPNDETSESVSGNETTSSAQQSEEQLTPPTPDENELPIIPVQ